MSIQNEVPITTPARSHKDAAATIIDEIRGLKDRIPHFVIPESKAARQRLARAASLPPEFVDLASMATRNNEELARGGSDSGPAQTEDLRSYAEAYGPLADELEAMALFVRHSVRAAKNQAGSNALLTYAMAQRLAKRPETASRTARGRHAPRAGQSSAQGQIEAGPDSGKPRSIARSGAAAEAVM